MVNRYPYEFDPEEWRHKAGDPTSRWAQLSNGVTSPVDVFRVELERQQLELDERHCSLIPSDTFVWAYGEPSLPWVTKLGGVPYRPAGACWPQCAKSEDTPDRLMPMTFLMQFCFRDSVIADLNLPGEVLLVFAKDDRLVDEDAIVVEWQSSNIDRPMTVAEVPKTSWDCIIAHAYRWRTWDVEHSDGCTDSPYVLRATKIGGIASCSDAAYGPTPGPLGSFLCQIAEVAPIIKVPYPWINIEKPIEPTDRPYDNFALGDAGVLCFFLSEDGSVNWRYEYY